MGNVQKLLLLMRWPITQAVAEFAVPDVGIALPVLIAYDMHVLWPSNFGSLRNSFALKLVEYSHKFA